MSDNDCSAVDIKFMKEAIAAAKEGLSEGGIPIGMSAQHHSIIAFDHH